MLKFIKSLFKKEKENNVLKELLKCDTRKKDTNDIVREAINDSITQGINTILKWDDIGDERDDSEHT